MHDPRVHTVSVAVLMVLVIPIAVEASDPYDTGHELVANANEAPVFWDPVHAKAYLVGGIGSSSIITYDPATGDSAVVASIPGSAHGGRCGAWDPYARAAYIFGGWTGPMTEIYKFTPDDASVVLLGQMPSGNHNCAAVWDPSRRVVHVFGGTEGGDRIWTFSPQTLSFDERSARLPSGRVWIAATFDEATDRAILFGGYDGSTASDAIVTFSPRADATVIVGTLPYAGRGWPGALVNRSYYLFGGYLADGSRTDQIIKIDLDTLNSAVIPERLAHDGVGSVATTAQRKVLLFGGSEPRSVFAFDTNLHPVAIIKTPLLGECSAGGARLILDGSGSYDPDGDPISFAWSAPLGSIADPTAAVTEGQFPLGETPVTLAIRDGFVGRNDTASAQVNDTIPPTLNVTFDPPLPSRGAWLAPPRVTAAAFDACAPPLPSTCRSDTLPISCAGGLVPRGERLLVATAADTSGNPVAYSVTTRIASHLVIRAASVPSVSSFERVLTEGIEIQVVVSDDFGIPVEGASVNISVWREGPLGIGPLRTVSQESDTNVTGSTSYAPPEHFRLPGCYDVIVQARHGSLRGAPATADYCIGPQP